MKIVFLSFYSGLVYRGVETFVHELANNLTDFGHDVLVYQRGQKLLNSRYKIVVMSTPYNETRKGSYISFLNYHSLVIKGFTESVLSRIDKDIDVIFPTNGQYESLLCSMWAKRNNKRIIISGQSGPGLDDRINLFTFPDIFVGMTDFQCKWAKKANPFIKIAKIPNGVDLSEFKVVKNKNNKFFNLARPIILNASALVSWKRQELIIKAVSKFKRGSLVLVGKGEEKEKLAKLGNELLSGRFKIMSFKHDEMANVYKQADLFTFSTVPWESFGIVMLEAMACGLPVVATDDPIRREIVGDAGLFVDPNHTDEYAKKLKEALDINWGDKPRKQAEKFSWDNIAKKYVEIF